MSLVTFPGTYREMRGGGEAGKIESKGEGEDWEIEEGERGGGEIESVIQKYSRRKDIEIFFCNFNENFLHRK